jgi:hypothetical protein
MPERVAILGRRRRPVRLQASHVRGETARGREQEVSGSTSGIDDRQLEERTDGIVRMRCNSVLDYRLKCTVKQNLD